MTIDPEGCPLDGAPCAALCRLGGLLCAALIYAVRLGFRIVPAKLEPYFRPLVPNWPEAASRDPEVIRGWWSRWPDAAVCAATGAGSGVVVLDLDVKNGVDGCATLRAIEEKYGPIGPTWVATTPSGGQHHYVQHQGGDQFVSNQVHRDLGMDVRGDGGLVVLPPSARSTGAYAWQRSPFDTALAAPPYWLGALTSRRRATVKPKGVRRACLENGGALAKYVAKAVTEECEAVASTTKGGRNKALFLAACRLGELVGGGYLPEEVAWRMLEAVGEKCGLPPREVRATTKSGLNSGARQPRRLEVRR